MSFKGSQQTAMVDKLLTNVSNGYFPDGFISEKVLTPLEVVQDSGILPSYGNGHLRIMNTRQVGRTKPRLAAPVERVMDKKYFIEKHAIEGLVTEDDYRNVEQPYDAEKDETEALTSIIMVEKEYALASTLTNNTIITQTSALTSTTQWDNYTASNPIDQFKTALTAVFQGCGKRANKAIVPYSVFLSLKYNPAVLENLGFASNRAGTLTEQEVAKAMGVDELFIPDALYNAGKEGQADSMLPIWGKSVIFMHCPSVAAKQQISLGYYVKNKTGTRRVKKWNVENSFGDTGILVGDSYSFEIVNAKAAYLLTSVIA